MFRSFLLSSFLCLTIALGAFAHFESGAVVGTVRDTTGGMVAGLSAGPT